MRHHQVKLVSYTVDYKGSFNAVYCLINMLDMHILLTIYNINDTGVYVIDLGLSKLAKMIMTNEHKRILKKAKPKLITNLFPKTVLIELHAQEAIPDAQYQTVKYTKGCEQTECLIDILSKCADLAFYQFKEALQETGQGHLLELLKEPGETAASRTNDRRNEPIQSSYAGAEQYGKGSSDNEGK